LGIRTSVARMGKAIAKFIWALRRKTSPNYGAASEIRTPDLRVTSIRQVSIVCPGYQKLNVLRR
jgi:hypothetical protein